MAATGGKWDDAFPAFKTLVESLQEGVSQQLVHALIGIRDRVRELHSSPREAMALSVPHEREEEVTRQVLHAVKRRFRSGGDDTRLADALLEFLAVGSPDLDSLIQTVRCAEHIHRESSPVLRRGIEHAMA
jgi:hypothetical protein